jgi:carbonic anhydrase/acetyltransferase-like protein (isoleucine patch superfamily)
MVQCYSLKNGTFKSDHTNIGSGCTIGVNAFIHYGVVMAPDSALAPNSFMMKSEWPAANSLWSGNPAKEVQVEERSSDQVRLQLVSEQSMGAVPAAGRECSPMLDRIAARST